jgi:hypothetical protein
MPPIPQHKQLVYTIEFRMPALAPQPIDAALQAMRDLGGHASVLDVKLVRVHKLPGQKEPTED